MAGHFLSFFLFKAKEQHQLRLFNIRCQRLKEEEKWKEFLILFFTEHLNLTKNKHFYLQNKINDIGFFFADKIYENFIKKSKTLKKKIIY
jgi:hypothetical protein